MINPDAPVLIMTTEIYRNMLLSKDEIIDHVKYVVFDEIHFMNDIERGTIWEESIIFSPEHIRFLCLSATIPNVKEFATWIQHIKKHKVDVVKYDKRAVPLKHHVYDTKLGMTTIDDVLKDSSFNQYYQVSRKKKKRIKEKLQPPSHINLVREIEDKLPCIIFNFSRKDCEKKAVDLSNKKDFLNNKHRTEIITLSNKLISAEYRSLESIQRLKKALNKGIAFHHAGLLPKAKELVEILFSKGIIKVLYATETFAVGINMPAKTVCFASLNKFDGVNFRQINSKEYFQMGGRAGRRGIDKIGYVITIIDRFYTDLNKLKQISMKDDIPIQSQFKLSFNTVLNLVKNHKPEEREQILKMNFDYFLKKQRSNKQVRIKATYNNKVKILKSMGYIYKDALTEKGKFATRIYSNELIITELFCSDLYKQLSDAEINILIAAILYEPRRKDYFTLKGINKIYSRIMKIVSKKSYIIKNLNKLFLKRMIRIIGDFSNGCEFKELLDLCSLDEGDLIRMIRRLIDMIRQVRHATNNHDLIERLHDSQDKIYRDVIRFEF